MTVGQRLKELRQVRKISQQELADLLDISIRAWQYYESDQRELNVTNIIKVADYFNVTTDYLLGRTDILK